MPNIRRFRIGGLTAAARLMANGVRLAIDSTRAVVPRHGISRRGFLGHGRDGGVERFRRLTEGVSEQELLDRLFIWERHRTVFLLAAAATTALMPIMWLYGYGRWHFLLGLVLLVAFSVVKAMEADFSAWRIRQRRMAPLAEYLRGRVPGGMQIMDE